MRTSKTAKIIFNTIYIIGAAITIGLGIVGLFGSNEMIHPDAMIPFTWKEQAVLWLAFGTIPMNLACIAAYHFNKIKDSIHKKRNFILLFLPGFICAAGLLCVIGVIFMGFVNSFLLHRR